MKEKKIKIEWLSQPEFKLLNDGGRYRRHECIRAGLVELRVWGEVYRIDFKEGWPTDVTSTPRWAEGFVPQLGPYTPASVLHDRLLDEGWPRKKARAVMVAQLFLLTLVPGWQRFLIVGGVTLYDLGLRLVDRWKELVCRA